MKKINLERFELYQDIAKTSCVVLDAKNDFANLMYNSGSGLPYHALALKIYNSAGETEYSDNECELMRSFAERCCTPAFYDSLLELLNNDN